MKHLGTSAIALLFASGAAFAEEHTTNQAAQDGKIIVEGQGSNMQGGNATQGANTNTETVVVESDGSTMQTQNNQNTMATNNRQYTVDDMYNERGNLIRAGDITGGTVYSLGSDYTGLEAGNEPGQPLENAANETGNAINNAGNAVGNAADNTANAVTGRGMGAGWNRQQYTQVGENWNNIGSIEDVVLSKDGQMTGIVAEIGGFLGIGDTQVLIPVNDVSLVPSDDGNYAFVTRLSEDQLKELPDVDDGFWN